MGNELMRCGWAKSDLEKEYHDSVWGKPMHDDHELFKKLILDGQQAGLNWSIILKKMDGLCAAYDDFDPYLLARYDAIKIDALLKVRGVEPLRFRGPESTPSRCCRYSP